MLGVLNQKILLLFNKIDLLLYKNMTIFSNKAINTIALLLVSISGFAAPSPPPPEIPDPEDLPIDENLIILLFLALLFGLYKIYKHSLNKKTPI
jgi:hypothetical protein